MTHQTYTFHVKGMHCASCVHLTESELSEVPGVTRVKASLKKLHVEVTGDFGEKTAEVLAEEMSRVLAPHGYSLTVEKSSHTVAWKQFFIAIPIAGIFIALFILLQRLGIVNLITSENVSLGTAFLIGIIASVSTCMAIVGGLVLSISATYAQRGERIRPQLFFHIGRLVSFFVLGGVIGALGSMVKIGGTGTIVLSLIVAIVLLILGINLLDIFPWMKRFQLTLPSGTAKILRNVQQKSHMLTPVLLGIATFILPCGFTQSMQLYALSTGSFWSGAMTMGVFALGTLPVLAILSFSSVGIRSKQTSGVFFKTAGFVVIFFGLLNLVNSLVAARIIPPIFSL